VTRAVTLSMPCNNAMPSFSAEAFDPAKTIANIVKTNAALNWNNEFSKNFLNVGMIT
jgi:hypothetical protein